jgi:DNA-binding NarL/FixJ family response regulator
MSPQNVSDCTNSPALNSRQKEVLFFLSKGLRNSEIGAQLGLSERTIKYYVNQLLLIFDATNRTELVGRLAEGHFTAAATGN